MSKRKAVILFTFGLLILFAAVIGIAISPDGLLASSHREAPITSLDQKADITDIYAFRSYDAQGHDTNPPSFTMILCVDPFLEPANGQIGRAVV